MKRTWAVARQTIREGIRMKIAVVFILILAILLLWLFTVTGDGVTLKSRIQMFLSWSVWVVMFLLSMLTIFLACWALSNEVRENYIQLVAVKPIPRWQFVLGKWLGIFVLNAVLLTASGVVIYGFARYLSTLPAASETDRVGVDQEVLAARAGVPLKCPDLTRQVEERIRQLRSEDRLRPGEDLDKKRTEIRLELEIAYYSVPPDGFRVYLFKDLLVDRSPDKVVNIYYKAAPGGVPEDEPWPMIWVAGDPSEGTRVVQMARNDLAGRQHVVQIPADCVSDEGILRLEIHNRDARSTLRFSGEEGRMELVYGLGGFGWNLTRALVLIAWRLVFLAAVGLFFSSYVSFPIACMATLLIFFCSISVGFLGDSLEWVKPTEGQSDPLWILGPPLRALGSGFVWMITDLARFDPGPTLADGRVVTLMWLIIGAVELVFTRAVVLGFLACVIFTRRELARVIA